jgi:glycosyltransferase involved in cell wall biosynthesis
VPDNEMNASPIVSVIIPFYNEPDGLQVTLESLVTQTFPSDNFEIIVVDNGSTDNTLNVAKEFSKRYPHLIQCEVEDKIQSSYAARNKGIKVSKGEILCFIDSDMTVETDYLSRIVNSFKNDEVDYLGCKVDIYSTKNTLSSKYNMATGFPMNKYLENDHFVGVGCLSVKKTVIDKVGNFDNRLESGGDFEFGNRVYGAGFKQYYMPDIIMKHPARSSFNQLLSKAFRVGRGLRQISYYHPQYKKNWKVCRNILNPIYYLPVPPWRFFNYMKGNEVWDKASSGEKLKIYFIFWFVDILVKQFGYIYESLRTK